MSTAPVRIAFCGEKRIAENCLDFLHAREDTTICAVVTETGDWEANLIQWSERRGVKVFVGNVNDYYGELAAFQLDFLFSVQYRKLIRQPVLGLPGRAALNLHFGLLPRYGGCHPVAWAVRNAETEAGATLHFMSDRFDEGDIVRQTIVPLTPLTTARELYDRVSDAALSLFQATYPQLLSGEIPRRPQDLAQKLYYRKDSIDFQQDSVIDWHLPTREIQRLVCAFTFEPFQLPCSFLRAADGTPQRVSVTATRPWDGVMQSEISPAGTLMEIRSDGSILIATRDGALRVERLDNQEAATFCSKRGFEAWSTRFE